MSLVIGCRRPSQSLKVLLDSRRKQYLHEIEQLQAQLHQKIGHMRESESLIQMAEGIDHGADLVLLPAEMAQAKPPVST